MPTICTLLVLEDKRKLYSGRLDYRCIDKTKVDTTKIANRVEIPIEAFQPPFEQCLTHASNPRGRVFFKRPSLLSEDWGNSNDSVATNTEIAQAVRNEVDVYENLLQHPHINIAEYLGCEVQGGRISAICLVEYNQSLMQLLNPGSLSKRAFAREKRGQMMNGLQRDSVVEGVRAGLAHIHSLGLVHNDLNPANIMLDKHDTPELVDWVL